MTGNQGQASVRELLGFRLLDTRSKDGAVTILGDLARPKLYEIERKGKEPGADLYAIGQAQSRPLQVPKVLTPR